MCLLILFTFPIKLFSYSQSNFPAAALLPGICYNTQLTPMHFILTLSRNEPGGHWLGIHSSMTEYNYYAEEIYYQAPFVPKMEHFEKVSSPIYPYTY
jgi:hypothetical protein